MQDDGACVWGMSGAVRKIRAQALIAQRRLSIEEVAQHPGFGGMSSFSQAYRRWTGVAPGVSRQGATGSWRAPRRIRRIL
ncbi:helix-turn-helix domain-containing protein [Burkholderia contaminans]|uniref:helix-turn-helix domain-containing protein n=1 Tax=Burkholderia contaminans TaxID=488447 RepID=UPI0031112247